MREVFGDVWEIADAAAIAITTNGAVRGDGACVMGRGIALQAKTRYPGIDHALGRKILRGGNHVHRLPSRSGAVFYSFPVKHRWDEPADLDLIRRSTLELSALAEEEPVLLPRPGCGNGSRSWDEVRPIVSLLDDRFWVVTYAEET